MTTVTDADREAYLALNMLPPNDAEAVLAGKWDHLTGLQVMARHREAAEQRALAKGIAMGIEAMRQSVEEVEGKGLADYCAGALDPAAIIAQHTRTKAMDELIAGDADLI